MNYIPIRLDNTNIVYTVPIPPPTKNGWKKLERMGRISKRFHEKVLRIIPLRPLKTSEVLGYSSQWTEYLNIKKGLLHS